MKKEFSKTQRKNILAQFQAGISIKDLAARYDTYPLKIREILLDNISYSKYRTIIRNRMKTSQTKEIERKLLLGEYQIDLAKEYGISRERVRQIAARIPGYVLKKKIPI